MLNLTVLYKKIVRMCLKIWLHSVTSPAEIDFWYGRTANMGLWHDAKQHPEGRKYFLKMLLLTTCLPFLIMSLPLLLIIALLVRLFRAFC